MHFLLPGALYFCCFGKLFRDAASVVDCFVTQTSSDEHPYLSCLPQEDVFRCLAALPELGTASLSVFAQFFHMFNGLSDVRAHDDQYQRNIDQAMKGYLWRRRVHQRGRDVHCLQQCNPLYYAIDDAFILCFACEREIEKRGEKARQDVWRMLPTFFGLDMPNWMLDTQ